MKLQAFGLPLEYFYQSHLHPAKMQCIIMTIVFRVINFLQTGLSLLRLPQMTFQSLQFSVVGFRFLFGAFSRFEESNGCKLLGVSTVGNVNVGPGGAIFFL